MSNLVKQSQLSNILGDLWGKVKNRDITSGEVTVGQDNGEKKLTLKRKDTTNPVDIDFINVALLDQANTFTQPNAFPDVVLEEWMSLSTRSLGTSTGTYDAQSCWSGCRNFTSDMFYGGYVNKLRIHLQSSYTESTVSKIQVTIVERKDELSQDIVRGIIDPADYEVTTNAENKYIEVPVNRTFDFPAYFLVHSNEQTTVENVLSITNGIQEGAVYIPRPGHSLSINNVLANTSNNQSDKCINYEVIGRLSIKEAINTITSEEYVLVSDTTAEGGTSNANKVARLGADGKLSTTMMPELSITRVKTYGTKELALEALTSGEIQEGDVVVITNNNNSAYMANGGDGSTFDTRFIELSMGTGTVRSIKGGSPDESGNIDVATASTDTHITMTFGTGGETVNVAEYMTEQQVNEIKALFTFDAN